MWIDFSFFTSTFAFLIFTITFLFELDTDKFPLIFIANTWSRSSFYFWLQFSWRQGLKIWFKELKFLNWFLTPLSFHNQTTVCPYLESGLEIIFLFFLQLFFGNLFVILFQIHNFEVFHLSKLFHLTASTPRSRLFHPIIPVLYPIISHFGSEKPMLNCLSYLFLFFTNRNRLYFLRYKLVTCTVFYQITFRRKRTRMRCMLGRWFLSFFGFRIKEEISFCLLHWDELLYEVSYL